jgi:3,4-dihydroxy 2-butanone 4-phosphate synthase/GTP cyclohydrolase II
MSDSIRLNSIEEIIAEIRQGRMVVIMDDEDRENEGDLIMAASLVRSQDINFMARYARGLICLTLTQERCQQLRLPLMVSETHAAQQTNFTVSIEAREGVTTGISAADRARTIRAAVAADARPEDLVQPGHIFPLMAQPGGVLTRAGHTEAGCDLTRLAGLEPAAVIVEILDDDGTMARRPQLEKFASAHGLKVGTVADLIRYRLETEKTVVRAAECALPTEWGTWQLVAFEEITNRALHFALVRGQIDAERPTLVRVHLEDTLTDLVGLLRGDGSWSLRRAMAHVAAAECGAVVVLRQRPDDRALLRRVKDFALEQQGVAPPRPPAGNELRTYGVGAQIVADLGIRRMTVMGTSKRMHGLSGFGLEVVDYIEHP